MAKQTVPPLPIPKHWPRHVRSVACIVGIFTDSLSDDRLLKKVTCDGKWRLSWRSQIRTPARHDESDANNEGLQAKSGLQGCMVGPNFLNKVTTQGTTGVSVSLLGASSTQRAGC